eukprot:6812364-Heterocapsa_arctica.AAC.1
MSKRRVRDLERMVPGMGLALCELQLTDPLTGQDFDAEADIWHQLADERRIGPGTGWAPCSAARGGPLLAPATHRAEAPNIRNYLTQ